MGRLADVLHRPDRARALTAQALPEPVTVLHPAVEAERARPDLPIFPAPFEDPRATGEEIPFIEVGGTLETNLAPPVTPRPPSLAFAAPPAPPQAKVPPAPRPTLPTPLPRIVPRDPPPASPRRGLITIRFQPVQIAQLASHVPSSDLIAYHHPEHPISGQYRTLAIEIGRQLPGLLPRVIVFTGQEPQVGTTTVLLNLAITLARQQSLSVAVVDADLQRPALASRLGTPAAPGLREVLSRALPPAWCTMDTAQENLGLLPAGRGDLATEHLELGALLDPLRERHDWTILDAGCWDQCRHHAWIERCDAIYLVARSESADSADLLAIQDDILQRSGRLRGCVLTCGSST